jgi:signal peptidase I
MAQLLAERQQPWGERLQSARGRRRYQPRHQAEMSPARRLRAYLREGVGILLVAILVSLMVKTFLVQPFFIPSGSMEPTLHGCTGCLGDRVLVDKLTTSIRGIHRGDVVVFHDSGGWLPHPDTSARLGSRVQEALAFIGLASSSSESDLVKRVIGVGGDTVEGRDGNVYVNGTQLKEPYVFPGDRPTEASFKVTVPAGRLWVMGDHRSDSSDSRFHQDRPGKGTIAVNDVVGRALVIVWPLGRVGSLT